MSPSFSPIAPWPLVLLGGAAVVALTLWTYRRRLHGTSGRWRWVVLGLRMLAVILCILAAFRPSMLIMRKDKVPSAIVFLIDGSSSMAITDEANNESRFGAAKKALADGLAVLRPLREKVEIQTKEFDDHNQDFKVDSTAPPEGNETAIGVALDEMQKALPGVRIVSAILLSDGANNAGLAPLTAARRLKSQEVPIVAVGFGSESAGESSRDVSVRDFKAGPTVFVKNELEVQGTLGVRGFAGQPIEVELLVENNPAPVARTKITPRPGATVVPITGLKWTPQIPGETKLTLRVPHLANELVQSNNQVETYVTVQKGGIAVLYLGGPKEIWEPRYITWSLDSAREVQVSYRGLRRPVTEDPSILPDAELAPGKFDVLILGDVPAEFLTPVQQALIVEDVKRGMGLMMLGGRSSFGPGGWATTEVADVLPTRIHPGDDQIEPENGLKVIPVASALENYLLKLAPTPGQSQQIWDELRPIPGASQLGPPKESAIVLATIPGGEPVMVINPTVGAGRVLAFAGETWPWFRDEKTQPAHRRFWRQIILWLSHKEDEGEDQIRLALEERRVNIGQKLDVAVTARDAHDEPLTDVTIEASVERVDSKGEKATEPVAVFNQGTDYRGSYFATGEPGEYVVKVKGTRNGQEIGSDQARFIVYQENRELERPEADFALLHQLAEITGGKVLPPEQLESYLKTIGNEDITERVVQKEVLLWDNWPFLLLFVAVLVLEWFLRKRHGWV